MLSVIGRRLMDVCAGAGESVVLGLRTLRVLPQFWGSRRAIIQQINLGGIGSILVLSLIAGLTGMIMVMQMGPSLQDYGALDMVGGMLGVTFTRELGPIWAAVIILARVGSAMAAEIGTMNVNEEVDALRVMNINPVRYLVLPRVLALVLCLPLLTALADVVGLLGGAYIAEASFGVPYATFADSVRDFVRVSDVLGGLIKSVFFAVIIGVIACAQGLRTEGGAEGVGHSTTNTVRLCVIFVLIADLVLTQLLRLVLPMGIGV